MGADEKIWSNKKRKFVVQGRIKIIDLIDYLQNFNIIIEVERESVGKNLPLGQKTFNICLTWIL
jgi:hypothetical protein